MVFALFTCSSGGINLFDLAFKIRIVNVQKAIEVPRNVQVGKDQEKAQSEKDFHSKNRGGKKTS